METVSVIGCYLVEINGGKCLILKIKKTSNGLI